MADVWEAYVPAEELRELRTRGFGRAAPVSGPVCLLVIDVVLSFLGDRPGTASTAWPTGCGQMGWERLPRIVDLIDTARESSVPVVFTKGDAVDKEFAGGSMKLTRDPAVARAVHEAPFPEELRPRPGEYVLAKPKASAFFGTPLLAYLNRIGARTLMLVGTTTSGCVRATAVDACSYNYEVVVVEDACFDRSRFAHAANLFDIQMKYGDVMNGDAAVRLLRGRKLPERQR